ncbi:MAG TPA: DoxX family protein [Phycisphaerae bacterium]|nr:DoxX family protein [Phycisphaerae bacterium]
MPTPVDSPAGSTDTVDKRSDRLSWPRAVVATDSSAAGLVLRVMLGVVMFPHGAQKLLGWFGGYGFSATMNHFTENMGIPWVLALLAVLAESVGAVALIVGLLTRIAALGIGVVMTVAIVMVHWQNGFFMNWLGNKQGEGFEYHLLALAMAAALIIRGGGLWSVDRALAGKPT